MDISVYIYIYVYHTYNVHTYIDISIYMCIYIHIYVYHTYNMQVYIYIYVWEYILYSVCGMCVNSANYPLIVHFDSKLYKYMWRDSHYGPERDTWYKVSLPACCFNEENVTSDLQLFLIKLFCWFKMLKPMCSMENKINLLKLISWGAYSFIAHKSWGKINS